MTSPDTAAAFARDEETLRILEAELANATERSRHAKQVVKDAKSAAKAAKRDKRRARKALAAAQEAYSEMLTAGEKPASIGTLRPGTRAPASSSSDPNTKPRIAGSPEQKRRPPRQRKAEKVRVRPSASAVAGTPGTQESTRNAGEAGGDESIDPAATAKA